MDEELMKVYAARAVAYELKQLTIEFIKAALQGGQKPAPSLVFECAAMAESVPECNPIPEIPGQEPGDPTKV